MRNKPAQEKTRKQVTQRIVWALERLYEQTPTQDEIDTAYDLAFRLEYAVRIKHGRSGNDATAKEIS